MMTLRLGPGRGKSPYYRDGGRPAPIPPRSGDPPVATVICPHCPQCVTSYRFTMGDGLPITTHHCAEHGDVISRGVSSHTTTHNEEER